MAASADPELGRVLLEQKPNRGNIGNCIFLLLLGLMPMGVLAAPTAPLEVRLTFFALGLGLCGFAVVMLWRNWMHVFLQERGIREYRRGKGRSLPYDRVDEVQFSSVRICMHGGYIRTVQKLAFRSEQLPDPPLVCTLILKEADGRAPAEARTALTQVRDTVSRLVAERFHKRVQRGEAIPWTPEARISRYGVETEAGGAETVLKWQQISKLEVEQETLRLWVQGGTKPRLKMNMTEPNFYPAYMVALSLMRQSGPG